MKSALNSALRFRGPAVAAMRVTPSGALAGEAAVQSGPGAGCVDRLRQPSHEVPRSRARLGRPPRGRPSSFACSGLANIVGGVCRCHRGQATASSHYHRALQLRPVGVRQPNNALERTVIGQRNRRRHRAAAQRER
jgi:hypothetical protein